MPDNETLTAEEQALIANHRARKVANVNAQAEVDAIMAKKGQLSADELEKLRVAIIANLPKYVPIP